MKKLLIVFLALILILGGLFIWKGGHHAVALAEALEEWADADAADQTLILQLSGPAFSSDGETITPAVRQVSLTADTFWTEYADRRVFGLTAGEFGAYLIGGTLYMDTGRAYSLPGADVYKEQLREFLTGLLLYGRVARTERGYEIRMERSGQEFSAAIVMDRSISSVTVNTDVNLEGQPMHLSAVLTANPTADHPLPQAVRDAVVLAQMEPPMPLTEPLEVLLGCAKNLLPLYADAKLSVECGILTLSETVGLSVEDGQVTLTRGDEAVPVVLPGGMEDPNPFVLGLLVLRSGDFTSDGSQSTFRITIPAETTAALVEQLVPQAAQLGITFEDGEAVLTVEQERLTQIRMSAQGGVPFLVTTIPLSFSAEFDIH